MTSLSEKKPIDDWQGEHIAPGESRDVKLAVSESYSSLTVEIPIRILRAEEAGPVVLVTGALHGDEINGTGAIRHLIQDDGFRLLKGALVLVPVLNILAFDRHSRYLPDRRDLNRCFPGNPSGSLASRMAYTIFNEVVARCDYGIDLHTAAVRRTNFPNVRADMSNPEVRRIAEAFGAEIIVNNKGPSKALRREACAVECPMVVVEGGEVWKVEPRIVDTKVRGVKNVLRHLGMLAGGAEMPSFQVTIRKTSWLRAERGGFLQFHVSPGDLVEEGQPMATNSTLLGREHRVITAPFDSVVIGMTTLPAISPGDPVFHLGRLPKAAKPAELRRLRSLGDTLEDRVLEDLSSGVHVTERSQE